MEGAGGGHPFRPARGRDNLYIISARGYGGAL